MHHRTASSQSATILSLPTQPFVGNSIVTQRLYAAGAFKGGIRAVWHADATAMHVQTAANALSSALQHRD